MLTPFGKALRKLRIDRGWLLKGMADGIEVTPSFLSAVEAGRKAIPTGLVEKISKWQPLSPIEKAELERAAAISAREFKITVPKGASDSDREALAVLARRFEEASSDDFIKKVKEFLEKTK